MGALIFQPEIEPTKNAGSIPELDLLANEIKHILQGTSSDIIEELFILGGSSEGTHPKVFVGYNPHTGNLIHGLNNLPDGFEDWIIKSHSLQTIRKLLISNLPITRWHYKQAYRYDTNHMTKNNEKPFK